jgi:hypothetical protein
MIGLTGSNKDLEDDAKGISMLDLIDDCLPSLAINPVTTTDFINDTNAGNTFTDLTTYNFTEEPKNCTFTDFNANDLQSLFGETGSFDSDHCIDYSSGSSYNNNEVIFNDFGF